MSLPRYPEYKKSGVRWLGEMPAHWSVQRYKQVFNEREERSETGQETLLSVSAYTGVSPRSEIVVEGDHLSRAESLEGYKVCYANDLVMNIMLAWNRGLGFAAQHGIVSPAYSVFEPRQGNVPRFLDYMVRSNRVILYYKAFSSGVIDSRLRLYPDTFSSLYCVLPPRAEQAAIAAFLDRETAKINALIAEQQKLVALLAEKRQATISHAVTRGLDPNVPMKDSGVAWLGEVPAHWELKALKRALVLQRGHDLPSDERIEGVIPVVSSGGISGYHNAAMSGPTIVTGRYGTIGEFVMVDSDCWPLNTALYVVELYGNVVRYAWYMLQSLSRIFVLNSMKSAVPGVDRNDIHPTTICLPPLNEQSRIANFLDDELGKLDLLRAESEHAIALLKERRAALIAAAVTGQIKVFAD